MTGPQPRSKQSVRAAWRQAIFGAPRLTPAERLACLALAEHMNPRGVVQVNRQVLADLLRLSNKQRVTDRLLAACTAGYLSKLDGGSNGRPARYQAMIPRAERTWLADQQGASEQVPPTGVPVEEQVTGAGVPGLGYLPPADSPVAGTPNRGTNTRARLLTDTSAGSAPALLTAGQDAPASAADEDLAVRPRAARQRGDEQPDHQGTGGTAMELEATSSGPCPWHSANKQTIGLDGATVCSGCAWASTAQLQTRPWR
ncbi:hypothetical protein [uncultured Modestobacter sp.]|uniref:hypothetical protein n=1 Tax=uncultured Modestobacter sp. TaxID=380048 RepID=UPI002612FE7E|nr:hypothetical protein [uncultured Modestobacter sp.]